MSVFKRNGHWHYAVQMNGVRYRGALRTARTKAQAREAEMQELATIHKGTYGLEKGYGLHRFRGADVPAVGERK